MVRQLVEVATELKQRLANKFNSAVLSRQGIEYRFVKYECGIDSFAALEGVIERGVVVHPQIASEPYQACAILFAVWAVVLTIHVPLK